MRMGRTLAYAGRVRAMIPFVGIGGFCLGRQVGSGDLSASSCCVTNNHKTSVACNNKHLFVAYVSGISRWWAGLGWLQREKLG